jgi:protein-disulfide isomerase
MAKWKSLVDLSRIEPRNRQVYLEFIEKGLQADMAAVAKFLEDEGRTDDLNKHLKEMKESGINLTPGFEFLMKYPRYCDAEVSASARRPEEELC